MRKRVKTITEETHEYGTVVLEYPLYSALLGLATSGGVTADHVDSWVDKTVKISEDAGGEALTVVEHLIPITTGTPSAVAATQMVKTAF